MKLNNQKRIAAEVLKCSPKRVKIDPSAGGEIKEMITRQDMRNLINNRVIVKAQKKGVSRARANKILRQKAKGRQKGQGSRKGRATARIGSKDTWMNKVRLQRKVLKGLKNKEVIDAPTFRSFYRRAGAGFYRSKNHMLLHLREAGHLKNEK